MPIPLIAVAVFKAVSVIGTALAAAACGESNELFHDDTELPKGDQEPPNTDTSVDANRPPDGTPPPVSLNETMNLCFGLLASDIGDPRTICPKPLEGDGAGECDPGFLEHLEAFRNEMDGLISAETGGIPLSGILSGGGDSETSVPVTAIVALNTEMGRIPVHNGVMILTFGDNRAALADRISFEALLQYSRAFPMDSIYCGFDHVESVTDARKYHGGAKVAFNKAEQSSKRDSGRDSGNLEMTSLEIEYDHQTSPDQVHFGMTHAGWLVAPETALNYTDDQFDISIADYAIQSVVDSGNRGVEELLGWDGRGPELYRSALFYWH